MTSRDAARTVAISFAILMIGSALILADENSANDPKNNPPSNSQSRTDDPLLLKVNQAITVTERRFLSADVHTPWQILHGILALRDEYQIKHNGQKVNALEWIAQGQTYQGEHWFQKTATGGRAHPFNKPYHFEGHANQCFAILSMADLPLDFKFKADRGYVTIQNLIDHAKDNVSTNDEITWTLWALAHYLKPDAQWVNNKGENWSIERMVQIQTRTPLTRAACGGTHAMFALTYARNSYLVNGHQLRGTWLEADQKIKQHIAIAKSTQNRDGSFSASYFKERKYPQTLKRKVGTTGHILEFLMIALEQNRLEEQWVRNAVDRVATDFIQYKTNPLDVGIMYHALDALVIYKDRMTPYEPTPVAEEKPEMKEEKKVVVSAKPIIKTLNAEESITFSQPVRAPKPIQTVEAKPIQKADEKTSDKATAEAPQKAGSKPVIGKKVTAN